MRLPADAPRDLLHRVRISRSRRGALLDDPRVRHEQTAEHGGQYIDSRHHQIRSLAKELHVPLIDTEAQSFPAGTGDYFWFDGAFHTRDEIFADFPMVLDRLKKDYQRVGRYFYNQAKPDAVAFDELTMNDWLDANVPGGMSSLLAQAIERSNTGFWGLGEGNALFAGEHTSTHSQGYLNGGVESGERAARQVLNTLG